MSIDVLEHVEKTRENFEIFVEGFAAGGADTPKAIGDGLRECPYEAITDKFKLWHAGYGHAMSSLFEECNRWSM